jgi:hypothetical protein
MAKAGDIRLVEDMVARFPALRPAYERHLATIGELLPHVLLWEFADLVVAAYLGESALDWRGFLAYLETRLVRGDARVDGLIGTSLLEILPAPARPAYGIVGELGPLASLLFAEIRPAG